MSGRVDIGHDHALAYFSWAPDRSIPENARRFEGVPDIEKAGASIYHKKPDGSDCVAAINFDTPQTRALVERVRQYSDGLMQNFWTVESWEPLTVSPSLLCSCGDHGFIRDGKWVPA